MSNAVRKMGITATLESVLSTDELNTRLSRPPDYETENRALLAIAQHMADSPQTTLHKLVEVALEICQAGSAGVSLLSKESGDFYWPAVAGAWKTHSGDSMPRESEPSSVVLERNAAQLFTHPERYYTCLAPLSPPTKEALFSPFYVEGKALGTVWVVAHDDARKFDAEDRRLIKSLGKLAAAAYPLCAALDEQEEPSRSLRDVNAELLISSVRQHELTEQAEKAEAAVRESEERMHSLTANLLKAQEDERRRIARDLHDDVAQQLVVLEIELETLRKALLDEAKEFVPRLESIQRRAVTLANKIRDISHELHFGVLEELGLQIALETLVEEFERTHDLAVDLTVDGLHQPVPLSIATALYRIVQEALRNVTKHAPNSGVTILVFRMPEGVQLSVKDTGPGCDLKTARAKGGLGIVSMQERARQVGATFEIQSSSDEGTEIQVVVPLGKTK